MSRTLVIAEPGCTHEGNKQKLLSLIDAAAWCRADVFKPQWVSDVGPMLRQRHFRDDASVPALDAQRFANAADEYAYYQRAYEWLAFPVEWHIDFQRECSRQGLQYAVSVFLAQDVVRVAPLADYLKVSSFEKRDAQLLRACLDSRRPTIVSTGMADGPDVTYLYDLKRESGYMWHLLACTSAYPAPLDQMNIYAIEAERLDGLSDHSRNLIAGTVAVCCGAEVVETHFRLEDCDPENPDYPVAFTPAEFRQYIQNIRDAETMLGDGVKRIQDCERPMLPYRVRSE